MPTYEYGCSACGHQWEQVQRIVEAPIEVCPKCAKHTAQRLISGGTNFILKGGGWYSDLYSSSKPKTAEKASEASSSGEPGSTGSTSPAKSDSGTKSESKAESKAESKPAPSSPPSQASS